MPISLPSMSKAKCCGDEAEKVLDPSLQNLTTDSQTKVSIRDYTSSTSRDSCQNDCIRISYEVWLLIGVGGFHTQEKSASEVRNMYVDRTPSKEISTMCVQVLGEL